MFFGPIEQLIIFQLGKPRFLWFSGLMQLFQLKSGYPLTSHITAYFDEAENASLIVSNLDFVPEKRAKV